MNFSPGRKFREPLLRIRWAIRIVATAGARYHLGTKVAYIQQSLIRHRGYHIS